MKKVLIISYSFPPLNNIASRRFGEMVSYMEQFGWRPYIITTQNQGVLPLCISEEQCIRLGYHPQVNDGIHNMDITTNKLPNILEFTRSLLRKINFRFFSVDRTLLTWGKIVKEQTALILHKFPEIDLVIASYGPAASIWLGKWFATQYAVPWIADYRDLAALCRDNRPWLAYNTDCIIEQYLLKKSSGISTVSNKLANLLSERYDKRCETIYNGWNNELYNFVNTSCEKEDYVYYAGQFYNHRMKAVYLLLEALTSINSICFKVRSLGPVEMENRIITYAEHLGIKDRVEILPPCNPNIVEEEALHATANIVLEDIDKTNPWSAGTLTGKFLQLLPSTVPIISIARADNEMGNILKHSGRGVLCSNVDQIKTFLVDVKTGPEKFTGNIEIINEFSKKMQAKKLCNFFDVISIKIMQ